MRYRLFRSLLIAPLFWAQTATVDAYQIMATSPVEGQPPTQKEADALPVSPSVSGTPKKRWKIGLRPQYAYLIAPGALTTTRLENVLFPIQPEVVVNVGPIGIEFLGGYGFGTANCDYTSELGKRPASCSASIVRVGMGIQQVFAIGDGFSPWFGVRGGWIRARHESSTEEIAIQKDSVIDGKTFDDVISIDVATETILTGYELSADWGIDYLVTDSITVGPVVSISAGTLSSFEFTRKTSGERTNCIGCETVIEAESTTDGKIAPAQTHSTLEFGLRAMYSF